MSLWNKRIQVIWASKLPNCLVDAMRDEQKIFCVLSVDDGSVGI